MSIAVAVLTHNRAHLLRECVENGTVSEAMHNDEMQQNHVRHDALEVMERVPPLPLAA